MHKYLKYNHKKLYKITKSKITSNHHIIITTLHPKHLLPDILRENQQNQTLFSIKHILMVNCSSKNKNVLFFSQRQFNTAYIYISKSVNKSHINREYIISS